MSDMSVKIGTTTRMSENCSKSVGGTPGICFSRRSRSPVAVSVARWSGFAS
jgi:hypothetical protein